MLPQKVILQSLLVFVAVGCVTETNVRRSAPLPKKIGSYWGYVQDNETVISPRFLEARPFSEGLAAVSFPGITTDSHVRSVNVAGSINEAGLWGYINEDGVVVVPAQFHEAGDFVNGYAVVTPRMVGTQPNVSLKKHFVFCIDKSGALIAAPKPNTGTAAPNSPPAPEEEEEKRSSR